MSRFAYLLTCIALCCFLFSGCDNGTDSGSKEKTKVADSDHDHDHDHDHGDEDHDHDHDDDAASHDLGPNGGHLYAMSPAGYQLEWVHYKGNNKNDFYLLDADGKAAKPAVVTSFVVKNSVGEDVETFTVDPVDADESGATAHFSLDDQALAIAMTLGVEIEVKAGDETLTVSIPAHAPHDH